MEAAIDGWFDAAFARDLAIAAEDFGPGWETGSVLCGAARASISLERWRSRLHAPDAKPVLEELRGTSSAFWDDVPGGVQQLSALLIG